MVLLPQEIFVSHVGTVSRMAEILRTECQMKVNDDIISATQVTSHFSHLSLFLMIYHTSTIYHNPAKFKFLNDFSLFIVQLRLLGNSLAREGDFRGAEEQYSKVRIKALVCVDC